jgi:NADPH:quinone reductase-like Zn-dependent oxidoreductase
MVCYEAILASPCVCSGLASGALEPIVAHTFSLDDAPAAHRQVIEQTGGTQGKIVLHPWTEQ